MRNGKHVITVFGSAAEAPGTSGYEVAYELGILLARSGFLVCNGGYGGTMEATAKGAHEEGGMSVGIITSFYRQSANPWISEVVETETPVERLLRLVHEGDGYVVLPGGTGTLLELAAVWEFINKGIVSPKPVILTGSFWTEVVSTVRGALMKEGRPTFQDLVVEATDVKECVRLLTTFLMKDKS